MFIRPWLTRASSSINEWLHTFLLDIFIAGATMIIEAIFYCFFIMKYYSLLIIALCAACVSSCGLLSKKSQDAYVPEETGLNVQKLSDETKNSVLSHSLEGVKDVKNLTSFAVSAYGGLRKSGVIWGTSRLLSISPDGEWLAYASRNNKQDNVMVRRVNSTGTSTQRTFRNITNLCWGADDNVYFSDWVGGNTYQISSVGARSGSLMRQLTSNNRDIQPMLSNDGKILFFVRFDTNCPSVWTLDFAKNTLTSCSRGYNPYPVGDGKESYLCVRNSAEGRSEIWLVNYINGQETIILSDKERGFSNPTLSPDGQWIVCEGNAKSTVSKKQNIDIFAVKIDGSNFIQLTYHPAHDTCPVWSSDGKSIYFISSRGTKDQAYNIWKMSFKL